MTFPWQRKKSNYDVIRELNQIELAIEWRTDQVRLLYQTIDFLRDHKVRLANKRDQYERYNRKYQS